MTNTLDCIIVIELTKDPSVQLARLQTHAINRYYASELTCTPIQHMSF